MQYKITQFVFFKFSTYALYNIIRGDSEMNKKFIVTPKTERSTTITVRIETEINQRLEELVIKSGRSRNELINKAIKFALDNLEFEE